MAERQNYNFNQIQSFFDDLLKNPNHARKKIVLRDGFSLEVQRPVALTRAFEESSDNLPLAFLMSGTSESGKSRFGITLVSENIATRFKVLRLTRELISNGALPDIGVKDDPAAFLKKIPTEGREQIGAIITREVNLSLKSFDTPIATIETISHPWLLEAFRSNLEIRTLSLFVDAPFDLRVKREANKTGLSLVETREQIALKDATKADVGSREIRNHADIIILNSGSLQTYEHFVKILGQAALKKTAPFTGKPFEYK